MSRTAHCLVADPFGKVPTPDSHLPSCPRCRRSWDPRGCTECKTSVCVAVLRGSESLGSRGKNGNENCSPAVLTEQNKQPSLLPNSPSLSFAQCPYLPFSHVISAFPSAILFAQCWGFFSPHAYFSGYFMLAEIFSSFHLT